ncbi:MAG TPA: acyltransferase [Natronosporangium sp.]
MGLQAALRGANRVLDRLVANTPPDRDRYVDLLRVVAIGVVVLWHWALSILYWNGERWVMPNPISEVPGGWLATWPLQIVTVFFIVGGYANSAGWWAAQRDGRGVAGYLSVRMRRLLIPIGVYLGVWAAFELVAWLAIPDYPGVLSYGRIVFTPLWFIAAYVWVVALTPLTATAHARARWLTLGGLFGAVALVDLGRFGAGIEPLGWLNTALVWVFIHQLGYFYRDCYGRPDGPPRWPALASARRQRWLGLALGGGAAVTLAILTSLPAYPRSMVATVGQARSNILPTTVCIAVVALLQLGLIMLARPSVSRWLQRARVWKSVVAGNAVILTVFLWHMTALLVVLAGLQGLGIELRTEPTAQWWAERPFWVVVPAIVLVPLVVVFGRVEWAGGRRVASGWQNGAERTD